MELNLVRDAKGSKKGFFRFNSRKRKTRGENGLAAEWDRGPENKGHGKGGRGT